MGWFLNCHAHTNFSDGSNTIRQMAEFCKKHGHCMFVSSDHDYNMDPCGYETQVGLSRLVSEDLDLFPIVNGLEISLWHEEAILIGEAACRRWLAHREGRGDDRVHEFKTVREILGDPATYALCLAHPVLRLLAPSKLERFHNTPEFYQLFDAYEDPYCGHHWDDARKAQLRSLMPTARAVASLDAHRLSYYSAEPNVLNDPITTESELIAWLKEYA